MTNKKNRRGKLPPLSEQLKSAILNSGETRYRIARATGISEATLSKYINGRHYLAQPTIDVLGDYLGLRLVARSKIDTPGNLPRLGRAENA